MKTVYVADKDYPAWNAFCLDSDEAWFLARHKMA